MLKRVDVAVFETVKAVPGRHRSRAASRRTTSSRRRRLLHLGWLPRRRRGPARGDQGRHHRRQDHGADAHPDRSRPIADTASLQHEYGEPGGRPRALCYNGTSRRCKGEHGQPTPLAVELSGIEKRFPGVIANHDVNLRRPPRHHPRHRRRERRRQVDADEDALRHAPARGRHDPRSTAPQQHFKSPSDAIAAGIGMVHQHFMLADNLTVLENIVLGAEPGARRSHPVRRGPRATSHELMHARRARTSTSTRPCPTSASASASGSRS